MVYLSLGCLPANCLRSIPVVLATESDFNNSLQSVVLDACPLVEISDAGGGPNVYQSKIDFQTWEAWSDSMNAFHFLFTRETWYSDVRSRKVNMNVAVSVQSWSKRLRVFSVLQRFFGCKCIEDSSCLRFILVVVENQSFTVVLFMLSSLQLQFML